MQIPLQQFEQYIDDTILQRGRSYFKNGAVSQIEEITPGLYEAIVEGTEDYTVKLHLKNGTITEYRCNFWSCLQTCGSSYLLFTAGEPRIIPKLRSTEKNNT